MSTPAPRVSVAMITHNHQRFIAQALDSVLMQETNFPFEIVIGEDHSTDGTRQIVEAYQRQHPDTIRLLLRDRNVGSGPNLIETFEACRGEYIAFLEGDDYWTDLQKLQIGTDFLDAHPEYTMCFHRYAVCDDQSDELTESEPMGEDRSYTLEDVLIDSGWRMSLDGLVHLNTAIFRAEVLLPIPAWFRALPHRDKAIFVMSAIRGKIAKLDREVSVYRVHGGGKWSGASPAARIQIRVEFCEVLRAGLDPRHRRQIHMTYVYHVAAHEYRKIGDRANARRMTNRALVSYPRDPSIPLNMLISLWLRLNLPMVHSAIARAKRLLLAPFSRRRG